MLSLKSNQGCDSNYHLRLSINKSYFGTSNVYVKDKYLWPVNYSTYDSSGIYFENLKSPSGCDSIFKLQLTIYKSDTVYLPNSFTPNENGTNDAWAPLGINMDWYEILILNRWGEILWRGEHNQPFDGSYMGKPLIDGVYVYSVNVVKKSNIKVRLRGTITIIR